MQEYQQSSERRDLNAEPYQTSHAQPSSFQEATLKPASCGNGVKAPVRNIEGGFRGGKGRYADYGNNKSLSVFDKYHRRYNNANKIRSGMFFNVERPTEEEHHRTLKCSTAPVPKQLVQPGILSFSSYLDKYGYYIDEMTQYMLDSLPSQAIGGGTITWNPEVLRDAVAKLCYDTSWNKHRRFTLLP